MPNRLISYDNPRTHDRFDIYLTDDMEFDFCRRHVCGIGKDAIEYSVLSEVPQPDRNIIEHQIHEHKKKFK